MSSHITFGGWGPSALEGPASNTVPLQQEGLSVPAQGLNSSSMVVMGHAS